ncbi:MAG: glycosyltransferase [Romboutsia sp.]
MEKFSVLLSVYKKENPEYLKVALKSILNQTIRPSEIVVVKDGPLTEELECVLNSFYEKNKLIFNVVELKENRGLGVALAKGVENCKFELVARMDTDDICEVDRFEKQLNILQANKDIGIVGSYIKEFDGDIDNIISQRIVPIENKDIKRYARKRNPFNHMTVMYRKQAVLESGNYSEFLWNEDYHLWVRMIQYGVKCYNIPEFLVYARTGDDMFKRRGGIKYALKDIELQKYFYSIEFIKLNEFIINIISRTTVRLLPNNLRKSIYKKFLRHD